ncbi:hypothetical protein [Pseudomonas citronellolis]|uniref:hypothetical protein n=1 Tax=Pseudomonas citronellolis TaxID=53408 RepID=UPI0023E3D7D8|nr:hypothetical protein [Pseudomonas citronellolis]MDF3932243.1 hypothetical protein [Pseudomonas citronellolis]
MREERMRRAPGGAWRRVWDEVTSPFDRISEATYGVIMTLTIVSVLSAAGGASREGMIAAALGCNLAWGLVDALMLLVRLRVERLHRHNRFAALRREDAEAGFRAGLEEFLPGALLDRLDGKEIWGLRQQLLASHLGRERPPAAGIEDYLAALLVVALVFFSTFPLVLPLWWLADPQLALRSAQFIGVLMLALLGWLLSRWAGDRSPLGALGFTALGVGMILLCVALGG